MNAYDDVNYNKYQTFNDAPGEYRKSEVQAIFDSNSKIGGVNVNIANDVNGRNRVVIEPYTFKSRWGNN